MAMPAGNAASPLTWSPSLWVRMTVVTGFGVILAISSSSSLPPAGVVPAAAIELERRPDLHFVLYGDEGIIAPLLSQREALAAKSRVVHCDVAIKMTDKPSQALRHDEARGVVRIDIAALSFRREAGIVYRRPGEISPAARALIGELRKIAARLGHV